MSAAHRVVAELTPGWPTGADDAVRAVEVEKRADEDDHAYDARVAAWCARLHDPDSVVEVDELYRRSSAGFAPLKAFLGALLRWHARQDSAPPVICRLNAFAYAFLKRAKNIDLILPERQPRGETFTRALARWRQALDALAQFERDGEPLLDEFKALREPYLQARPIFARRAARDERRALAVLLFSGPSTLGEIGADLGTGYDLNQRVLAPFAAAGLITVEPSGRYALVEDKLPVTLFGLRESTGLDPLSVLE